MSPDQITEEVRALERLDLEGLRDQWRRRWGAVPALRSPELLRRMIAWRIQVAAFGDLSAEARRSLRRPAPTIRGGIALSRGTKLTREWRGALCEVEVVDGGYAYAGVTYRSLSKIAGVITGTKWNGRRFFGLDKEASS